MKNGCDTYKNNDLLSKLAKQLGSKVLNVEEEQFEDFCIGEINGFCQNRRTRQQRVNYGQNLVQMVIEFDKSFEKSLTKIKNKSVFSKLEKVIHHVETASSIVNITGCKKLTGYKDYYRIRLGEYRRGFEKIDEETIHLIVISHRKEGHNIFP